MKFILLIITLPMLLLSCEKDSDITEYHERTAPTNWEPRNPYKGYWRLVATYDQKDTVYVTDGRGVRIQDVYFSDCSFIDASGAYITYKYTLGNTSTGQELNVRRGLYRFKPSKVNGKLLLEWSKTNFVNIFEPYNSTSLDSVISMGCF